MRCARAMKCTPLSASLSVLLAGLLLAILVVPLSAQPAGDSRLSYDVRQEISLTGTVSGVVTPRAGGMQWGSRAGTMWGFHLLLTTASGPVDASLGRWGLQGKGAPSVTVGQQIEVTGIMKTFRGKEVLLVRTMKVGGKVFPVRDEHGVPISPQTRELAARRGESL